MKKLYAIGESLIDFIPNNTGDINQINGFNMMVGGAPLNVCGAFRICGGNSSIITMCGNDLFGQKIINEIKKYGISLEALMTTSSALTSLAFVTLEENGNRNFSFYRNPGADMLYDERFIKESWFKEAWALHFCSVDLVDCPMKNAHVKAIEYASDNEVIVSFDPNLRFNLWSDHQLLHDVVNDFIGLSDIVIISDEELSFITGTDDISKATLMLFEKNVKLVIYTMGAKGAMAFTRNSSAKVSGVEVDAVDTTGAGDGFIGSFLYMLQSKGYSLSNLAMITEDDLLACLTYANKFSALSVTKKGALASYSKL